MARIKLTPSRLADFRSMTDRNRDKVGYAWFCLELDDYDCTKCELASGLTHEEAEEVFTVTDTEKCPITTSFQKLFSILSTWDRHPGGLTLDISIYSPSDSRHWSRYLGIPLSPKVACISNLWGGPQ